MRLPIASTAFLAALGLLAGCGPGMGGPEPGGAPPPPPSRSVGTGQACGGIAGFRCAVPGDFCKQPPSHRCGAADQMGTCTPKPQVCAQIYQPVCGCDGKTYGNACTAEAAGASVAHEGDCRPT